MQLLYAIAESFSSGRKCGVVMASSVPIFVTHSISSAAFTAFLQLEAEKPS